MGYAESALLQCKAKSQPNQCLWGPTVFSLFFAMTLKTLKTQLFVIHWLLILFLQVLRARFKKLNGPHIAPPNRSLPTPALCHVRHTVTWMTDLVLCLKTPLVLLVSSVEIIHQEHNQMAFKFPYKNRNYYMAVQGSDLKVKHYPL